MQYSEVLYDHIGNSYPRKNTFIQHCIDKQDEIDREIDATKKQNLIKELKAFKTTKKEHAYYKALSQYHEEEKKFLKNLKQSQQNFEQSLPQSDEKQLKKLKIKLFRAQKECLFYKNYTTLCYDATLAYKKAEVIAEQMGEVIEHLSVNLKALDMAKEEQKKIDSQKEQQAKDNFNQIKAVTNQEMNEKISILKQKKKDKLISTKAYENEKKQIEMEGKKLLTLESYKIPSKYYKEQIISKRYEVTKVIKQKLTVIEENQSHVLRTTPIEKDYNTNYYPYLTGLFPGVGQLLNKQYVKMVLFLIAALFIYVIAVPYALGYGNYQAHGLASLVTLAEGGPKLHKSIMYMIEGIVALFLIIIAGTLLCLNFMDVKKVQKDTVKGIRPRSWFETKRSILEDGFPYLVSLPALVVIIFIVFVPIATTLLLSFTNMDPKNQSKFTWVGVDNYMELAKAEGMIGTVFWNILLWTIIWTICATTLAIVIGFGLALITNNERIKGKAFFRGIFILPWAVPAFITIMFFSIMLSRQGILTEVINQVTGLSLDVKNDPLLMRITLILLQGWLGSAYVFLLSTGVLQAIPSDLYEAAQIDGATGWQRLCRITLPMVLFQTAPLLIGQYTFNFNNFGIIFLFNGGGPFNPTIYGNLAGSSDILISYVYKLTMDNQQQAVGAAITILISLALMFFTFLGFKNSKAFKEERL